MQNLFEFINNSNSVVKSLFLILFAVPITFLVQLIFYFIIQLWISLGSKKSKQENKIGNQD